MNREWRSVRWEAIVRDHLHCRRCGLFGKGGHLLTAHHIVPRDQGGSDDLSNLITLCPKCHNLVEGEGYRTVGEIITIDGEPVPDARPYADVMDWRTWVYGGYKNPGDKLRDCETDDEREVVLEAMQWDGVRRWVDGADTRKQRR